MPSLDAALSASGLTRPRRRRTPLVEAVVLTYFAWRRTSSLQHPYVNCYLCIRIEVVVVMLVAPLALCLPTFP